MNARPPDHAPLPKDALAGNVRRVTFHNADNGFCVLKVQARDKHDLVPVIGHAPAIGAGEWVVATGLWFTDRQHGLQFKAETLKVTPPTGAEGIEKYLASGYMRGIGPTMAKRIVAILGKATFEIIEVEADDLWETSGIGLICAARLTVGRGKQKAAREISLFLHTRTTGVRLPRQAPEARLRVLRSKTLAGARADLT